MAVSAAALILASAFAAEQKPSLIGATRDQVLTRYGEPRSIMIAAGREIMFFARERVVLRDGVVVDVEPIAAEPASRRPSAPAAPTVATPAPADAAPAPAQPAGQATADAATTTPAAPAAATPAQPAPAPADPAVRPAETAPVREPEFAIKAVRPPSGAYVRSPPKKEERVSPPPAQPEPAASAPVRPVITSTAPAAARPAETRPAQPITPPAEPGPATREARSAPNELLSAVRDVDLSRRDGRVAPSPAPQRSESPDSAAATSAPAAPSVDEPATATAHQPAVAEVAEEKKAAIKKRRSPSDELQLPEPTEAIYNSRTYVIAFAVILVGGGFLIWRRRQRQLELAATAVSRNPFSAGVPATIGTGARFTSEQISKLDWKHFEELVAAYYGKTGVVAQRTKGGPDSSVHIKISWKGESRPFALVQCVARPRGLVEVKSLQELATVLVAEDIRRGYVVTPGKFSVAARDYAEEKHLTLMPGDIFLEKLNALPDSARAEVMQEVMSGDHSTPICPKCETRMVHLPDDPSTWRCPTHTEVTQSTP